MKLRNFPGPVTPAVALVCRLTVAAVFLYAGCEKIIAPQEFATAIYNYRLLPDWAINVLAVTLPYLEVLLAVCLLVSIYVRGASFIAALLFLVFAIALTINLVRGLDISCGCFGGLTGSISWFYLVRDVALMAISVFALLFDRGWSYFFTR